MRLSLRWHIYLTIFPLLLITVVFGGAGAYLLHKLGQSINLSIRENTDSVIYMDDLRRGLDGVDGSFQLALSGRETEALEQYKKSQQELHRNLEQERGNITVPGERELVDQLTALTEQYDDLGRKFFKAAAGSKERLDRHVKLRELVHQIDDVAGQIRHINREHMEQSGRQASATATWSLSVFAAVLVLAVAVGAWLAWRTSRTILQPIQAVIQSARAISGGNFDQVVPVASEDELGQLAQAFNLMIRHLRDYRQSQLARLLRAQRTSQATIDSFPDAVLVIDAEGKVEMANPAARHLLGAAPMAPAEPAAGETAAGVAGIWQPPAALRQPLTEALQGKSDYLPESFDKVLLLGASGRERAVLPHILTIRDPYGATLGAAVLLQDVTRLRLLDQMKSNLVATASHELKTPLTNLRMAVHLLFEEAAGPLTPKQTELLQDARDNCDRLLAMINNLLDLARLEEGSTQLNLGAEAPQDLLDAAAAAIAAQAEEKGVNVKVQVPPCLPAVAADATRIGTALRNLLDNALTYTDAGGDITLSAETVPGGVSLIVADTGCGIAAEYLPHVFEKFFRVPGQSRGGTGLGLAIVPEIVVAHGGTISCSSQLGEGTVFRLTLPRAGTEVAR